MYIKNESYMRKDIRRKLSMAARALDFAVAHPSTDVSYNTLVGRLKDRLARADQLANLQENGTSDERAAQAHRMDVRGTLEVHLRHLVEVASVAAEDHPELKTMFQAPRSGAALKVVITKAKALLEIAVPQKELFASIGMGDTFLDELTAAVNEFDRSATDAHTGRRDHVGASTDLPVATEDCLKMVRLFNGIYRAGVSVSS